LEDAFTRFSLYGLLTLLTRKPDIIPGHKQTQHTSKKRTYKVADKDSEPSLAELLTLL
jgi:hypothetical protein